jgi:hypothetical protein
MPKLYHSPEGRPRLEDLSHAPVSHIAGYARHLRPRRLGANHCSKSSSRLGIHDAPLVSTAILATVSLASCHADLSTVFRARIQLSGRPSGTVARGSHYAQTAARVARSWTPVVSIVRVTA